MIASKRELLESVDVFAQCPPNVLVKLINLLKQTIAFPGQYGNVLTFVLSLCFHLTGRTHKWQWSTREIPRIPCIS